MKNRKALTTGDREEEYGCFGRLPDDVIIDIFDRVNDCKLLTQCLLVSKHTASLIRLVSSVFINIHSAGQVKQNPNYYNRVWLHYKLINSSQPADTSSSWWDAFLLNDLASLYKCKAPVALQPFGKVKSAIVLNKSFCMDTISWMMEYSGGVNVIKTGAFLTPIFHNPSSNHIIKFWIASLFRLALTFLPMVAEMVRDHESLRDILVTTPSKKGLIHAAEDVIVKMRQAGSNKLMKMMEKKESVHMKVMEKEKVHMKVKVWDIDVPNKSIYYVFVVVSSSDNIDREVKAVTRRFWSDSSYWVGHHEDVIQEPGIERKMRELVEMKPCNFEYVWEGIMIR